MRLVWIFVLLALLVLIPFVIWGQHWESLLGAESAVSWLRGYGRWAWVVGLVLLISDLILPIPGTAVMSALGFIYGPVLGGVLSGLGSILSGQLAYGLCRGIGMKAACRLAGEKDLRRAQHWFARVGGWLVAWSRWIPLLSEVVACMAGLTRMPWKRFSLALACGAVPLGFTFAGVGHAGVQHPAVALTLSAVLPPILWLSVEVILRRRANEAGPEIEQALARGRVVEKPEEGPGPRLD